MKLLKLKSKILIHKLQSLKGNPSLIIKIMKHNKEKQIKQRINYIYLPKNVIFFLSSI